MSLDPLFDLDGRVAVITGGSRGLGRAMAEAFAQHGANVVIASRKLDRCIEVADKITAATGRQSIGVKFHAGEWNDSEHLVAEVQRHFGGVDVLVNNAGMSPLYSSLSEVSEELFDKVIGVNLKGAFRLSALAAEAMSASDGGSIINISSIAAVQPSPMEVVYGAAKSALNTMTIGLARTFGPKVRANVIMPGPFLTDIADAWDMDAFQAEATRSIPLRRAGEPSEIVGAAVYLASDASSYTSGAVIKVDGGWAHSPG